jgi:hypothetical protein
MSILSRVTLGLLSAMLLVGVHYAPASATEVAHPADSVTAQEVCNRCNGFRYQDPRTKAVYLVIDGLRHHVPDTATYFNLWAGWDGLRTDGNGISVGEPLLSGSYLAKEIETGKVYLVGRTKRHIYTMEIFHQYAFDVARIRNVSRASLPPQGDNLPGRPS